MYVIRDHKYDLKTWPIFENEVCKIYFFNFLKTGLQTHFKELAHQNQSLTWTTIKQINTKEENQLRVQTCQELMQRTLQ